MASVVFGFVKFSTGPFAGKPAPTGSVQSLRFVISLWERVYLRRGRCRQHGIFDCLDRNFHTDECFNPRIIPTVDGRADDKHVRTSDKQHCASAFD